MLASPALPMAAAATSAAAVTGAIWLWNCYGAIVFFENIRTGFVACFG